ncbi:MAG: HAD hydrolase-like protein [Blautia sp.]
MNCLRQANMKYKLILFDLDGTLLDTSPGIFNSVRFALKESGLPQLPDNQLSDFVGPPPKQMYMKKFGLDDKAAFEVAKKHREYGRTRAIYEAKPYPDIESTLRTLKECGCKLGVATLKSQGIAESVLKNQDLYSYMDVVVGMNDSETMTKEDTIRQAMSTLCISNNVLMVGDSVYDFEGAAKVGVDFIGVLYGFGFKKEDVEFYSSKIEFIREPKELLNLVTTEIVK